MSSPNEHEPMPLGAVTGAPGPLAGIRVIDFSRYLPGPYCSLHLAWLGAQVTVVERAPGGDPMRHVPPFAPDGTSLASHALLQGKDTVMLDLADPADIARAHSMVDDADVVLEGFRPGVADRMGIGYAELSARHAGLVYCSLSGYGQDGPWAQAAGHDANYESIAGLLVRSGTDDEVHLPAVPLADLAGGSFAATAICAGLLQAERSGRGTWIDLSLTEAALALHAHTMPAASTPDARRGRGLLTGGLACYRTYRCADGGFMAVGPIEPKFFGRMCELMGVPELASRQFDDDAQDELAAALAARFAERTSHEWQELLEPEATCVTRVLSGDEPAWHPQLAARGAAVELDAAPGAWVPASPYVFDGVRVGAPLDDPVTA